MLQLIQKWNLIVFKVMEKINASTISRPYPVIPGLEVKHRYLDLGGFNVHIAEAGTGEPLILLHGWPQHWYMWHHQMTFFSKYYRVIAPDIRGFGWSEASKSGYLKDQLAEDLKRLILTLDLQQVKLLSHDWGGWIGFIASAKYPPLFSKHFATNICPIWPKLSLLMIPATMRLGYMAKIGLPFFGQRMLKQNNDFVKYILTRDNRVGMPEEEKNIYADQFREADRAAASSKLYRSFLLKEYLPLGLFGKYHDLHLKTPSRILFGQNDFAIALSWLRGFEKFTDDLQIELVPDTGHFIVNERPDLVNERAFAFFQS